VPRRPLLTRVQVAKGLGEPLVNVLEDRRVLGDRQFGQVRQPGHRLVHPVLAGGTPLGGRLGQSRGIPARC
jgi:hypothetical protein